MKNNRRRGQKSTRRSQLRRHTASIFGVSVILVLLIVVVSVSGVSLKEKNEYYMSQEAELEMQIKEQEARAVEISELEEYVGTDEYVEQVAKDRLGLVHEDEIIFKKQ